MKFKNLLLTLLSIAAMAWLIITLAGKSSPIPVPESKTSEPPKKIETDETHTSHTEDEEIGDFPLFPSDVELSPTPQAEDKSYSDADVDRKSVV